MEPVQLLLYTIAAVMLFGAYLLWLGPSQKRQQIALLQQAYADLETGRGTYICCALRNASIWGHGDAYLALTKQIEQRLGGATTYDGYWLRLDVYNCDWREGRLIWINQMIAAVKKGREIPPPPQPPEYE